MTSLMTSVILFSCWVMIVKCRAEEVTPMIADFLGDNNGIFENTEQVNSGQEKFDLIHFRMVPLVIPALKPENVLYIEETVNHVVYRAFIAQPNQNVHDNFLQINVYTINDQSQNRSGPFNPEDLVSYKREDFNLMEGCYSIFTPLGNGSFRGEWRDCNIYDNGFQQEPGQELHKTPRIGTVHNYIMTFSPDSLVIFVPPGRFETATVEPYNIKRIAPRFPVTFKRGSNSSSSGNSK